MNELTGTLAHLGKCIDASSVRVPAVSKWSVGDHVEHVLIVSGGLAIVLASGRSKESLNPDDTRCATKEHVLDTGIIPRGVINAPPAGQPKGGLDAPGLRRLFGRTQARLTRASMAPETATAEHPLLGHMNRDELFRFLNVHARHHLVIIEEILAASPKR